MRILLIRHGDPDYVTDSLTAGGREEAALLGERLRRYPIRDAYVSPLGRAKETAAYTLEPLGREAEVLPWLAEFRGRMPDPETGVLRPIIWDLKPRFLAAHPELLDGDRWMESPVFDGTNVRQIWQETVDGVDALMARYGFRRDHGVWLSERNTRDTIALFCHFGISMAVFACLTGIPPMLLWHHTLSMTSSVTEIVTEERVRGEVSFRMTKLGDLTHLEAAGHPRGTAGLFPECYTGVDSTDPKINEAPEVEV